MIGQTISHYEILAKLGEGGMGKVYRAHDTVLGREVAIKVLPEDFAADPDRLARFRREAKTLASLNHPNIATIHNLEESQGVRFLVLELVEGETLDERLGRGPLDVGEALELGWQIADGLETAHEQGIIHRDLKPSNVKVTPGGEVKVLDFGLAKSLAGSMSPEELDLAPTMSMHATRAGVVLGTMPYMSPEQARGERVDTGTDVWAFGCVLYESLTGRRPFARATASETIAAILKEEPDWKSLPPEVPAKVRRLLRACLEKDSSRRLASLAEAKQEIGGLLHGTARRRLGGPLPLAPTRGRWTTHAAVALAVATIGMGAAWWAWQDRPAVDPISAPEATEAQRRRLVVLPFEDLTEGNEHLSQGIAQDINTQLSKVGGFVLIANGSARRVSQSAASYSEIADTLDADYIIAGSVSLAGGRVRVTASLVDPRTAEQLWANDYDRELSAAHIFTIRSDVAREVAGALDLTLSPSDEERLAASPTDSLAAYQAYQLGRFYWNKRTPQALETAIGHYERAIDLDPDYALAHAGLADIYAVLPWFDPEVDIAATLTQAEAAAKRALELDPSLGEAVTSLALVRESELDWEGAEIEFRRALELSPEYPTAHHWYANLRSRLGNHEAALRHIRTALDLDPLSLMINQDLGYNLYLAGQVEAAIQQYRRALELDENFSTTRLVLALTLVEAARFEEAAREVDTWSEVTARDPAAMRRLVDLAARHAGAGEASPLSAGFDLESLVPPWAVAWSYMLIGHDDKALDRLERAFERGITWELMLVTGPAFDPLRDDPRFHALVERIGLEG